MIQSEIHDWDTNTGLEAEEEDRNEELDWENENKWMSISMWNW